MKNYPNRRSILLAVCTLPAASLLAACSSKRSSKVADLKVTPLNKPAQEWQGLLSGDAYDVLFNEATEPPNSSALNAEKRQGTYICAACYLPMFASEHKFESGTGWPSFTQPVAGHLATKADYRLILKRTEYHCGRCGGHQGHVFDDGPAPRGERWCNNGLALQFVPKSADLPELRS